MLLLLLLLFTNITGLVGNLTAYNDGELTLCFSYLTNGILTVVVVEVVGAFVTFTFTFTFMLTFTRIASMFGVDVGLGSWLEFKLGLEHALLLLELFVVLIVAVVWVVG